MRAHRVPGKGVANSMANRIAQELGYPKAPGAALGGGIHVPAAMAVTTRHVEPFLDSTGSWCVPLSPEVEALNGRPGLAFVPRDVAIHGQGQSESGSPP